MMPVAQQVLLDLPALATLAQGGDPTGAGPVAKVVMSLGLLVVIVLLLRALWHQRGR
ncbi:hypothetical protein GIY23_07825 [Allosaccharopolyspora coralli]|uniref:Uncharacterized protein n=1 Tax=Allosaccharopolyspora coralli TaxID=2665642 RepID=A0A5Q3Q492_9PSEU|nr:hypothetical protein [Allosaccharopolyspora coralli]QGK69441.1 hypothetical protein GIY23_07825 [Allosaccharopolyspora coralli]